MTTALPPFLGLSPPLSEYATARIAVLPCPYDGTSTWAKGADRGPDALLQASEQLEFYDLELERSPCDAGIATLPAVQFAGDDPEAAVRAIRDAARRPLADDKFLLGIGGEHTVSIGLWQAYQEQHGTFSLLQIDAHADLRPEYLGTPLSHACVMRRAAELMPEAAIVSVGIRACTEEELDFARRRGIHFFPAHELVRRDGWKDAAVDALRDPVYVTVDLDGLDPSILPSTGTPMPGGLGWWDTLDLLRRVGERHRVIGCDLMELKPDPVNHHSQFLAAQLAYKMLGYFVRPG